MKAPRCKLCGKEHYGLCKDQTGRLRAKTKPADKVAELKAFVDAGKLTPSVKPDVKLFKQSLSEMAVDVLKEINASLTPAQKQKAYRERHKERVRESDKLRKRKKRDG